MSRPSIDSRVARTLRLSVALAVAASCGGGGDGGGSTTPPGTVARVDFTAPSPTMEVGQNMQTTVRYYDASSAQLSGRTVTYASSSASVASVSTAGLVTAAAPGTVTIRATVDAVVGNLQLTVTLQPIFFIAITPATPSVRPGETVTLTAQPQDAVGVPITGRVVSWSSANPALATITQGGVVTGVTPGNTYIRASADGRTDSVSLRVRSLNTPSITGTSSVTLVPGGTGSITGTN
ncbi:MAG: Ig-like domain-containing protein, partial [Vicinamibacterales bacterium]